MCGRYVLGPYNWAEYYHLINILPASAAFESYNIAPTQAVPIIVPHDDGGQEMAARWGLVPHWHKGEARELKYPTFNARIETAHNKPSFRDAWRSGRCLVPTSGWYEWKGAKGSKSPHFIWLERNESLFWFAGLYSRRPDGLSFTILTRSADPAIEHLHHRMPVILQSDQLTDWLSCHGTTDELMNRLGTGFGNRLKHHEVGPVRGNGAELIEPLGPSRLL